MRQVCLFLVVVTHALGCGSRSDLLGADPEPVIPSCVTSADCPSDDLCSLQRCVEGTCQVAFTRECSSPDPCMVSLCDRGTGDCVTSPSTRDDDQDGFRAPLPGFRPGSAGSCGGDCDDTRRTAFPGGVEQCDGVDNDCDGVVDNDVVFLSEQALPELPTVTRVATQDASGRRGIAFGTDSFALTYWGRSDDTRGYTRGLSPLRGETFSERPVTTANASSFGPTITWAGSAFGLAWSDARVDDNYEIFFARFDPRGEKLGPDLRVTNASGFSLHPSIIFDQGRYVAVYDDRRDAGGGGTPRIYGQFVSAEGILQGESIALSPPDAAAEFPSLAATSTRLAIAYTVLGSDGSSEPPTSLQFRVFDKSFAQGTEVLVLAENDARAPTVTAMGDRFLVTWDLYDGGPGDAIWGAIVSEAGEVLSGPMAITSGATFARSHGVASLGNRAVFAWADDRDGNFEIYAKVLGLDLLDVEPRRRLTSDPGDSTNPLLSLSDQGSIGIIFDDTRDGPRNAYFMSLSCGPGTID